MPRGRSSAKNAAATPQLTNTDRRGSSGGIDLDALGSIMKTQAKPSGSANTIDTHTAAARLMHHFYTQHPATATGAALGIGDRLERGQPNLESR